MYIRRTKTRSVKGKDYYSFRLVQAERRDGKVRPKTLLNLGANFDVPREQWGAVTQLAESLLQGQPPLFSAEPEVQAAARDLVSGLRARGFSRVESTAEQDAIATLDLDTLGHEDARSVGCERLCLHALEELGLPPLLGKLGVSERDARIALALVIAKMVHPSSEREALRWLQDDSAIRELLSLDQGPALSLSKLYNDLLWRHREALESGLFRQERQLLGLADTLVSTICRMRITRAGLMARCCALAVPGRGAMTVHWSRWRCYWMNPDFPAVARCCPAMSRNRRPWKTPCGGWSCAVTATSRR